MGGSIAAAASRAWPEVRIIGLDRAEVLSDARRRGWVHEGRASVGELADADLVVLATPIPHIVSAIEELGRVAPDVPVTDVGSTKRAIMRAARQAGLVKFVGGHPMAGGERGGLEHATPDLFSGRRWLVVPASEGAGETARLVEALARGVGAEPLRVDAEAHDHVMAYVSHLPQLLAVALANAASVTTGQGGLAMSGRALAEMTRLAASPPDLWQGIVESNADLVAEALDGLRAELDALDPRNGARDRLRESFVRSAAFREALEKVMS